MATGCSGKPIAVFSLHFDLDLLQWALFVFGLFVRAYELHRPSSVVFDEQVVGTFASYYLKRSFFLDGSPPLSAQLAAVPAFLAGHDGSFFNFTRIGTEYPVGVPFVAMRVSSCLIGSLLVPLVYGILFELGTDRLLAAIGALIIAVEPSLVLHSRLVMPESLLLTLCFACVYCLVRARYCGDGHGGSSSADRRPSFSSVSVCRHDSKESPLAGLSWLLLCGTLGGLAVSTRFVGFFTLLLAAVVVLSDYWRSLDNLRLSALHLVGRLAVVTVCVVAVPFAVYVAVWWTHVTVLTRALPQTSYRLSSPFIASLEGGVSLITEGQPKEVAYGSVLTLRHARGASCWLHSHRDLYPLTYPDGRGSSYQQQVTCYPFKDRNNWWIVKQAPAEYSDDSNPDDGDPSEDGGGGALHVSTPPRLVRHGDVVELLHGSTLRKLNSHNVAAPLSIGHQEVSGYIDYNVSMPPHTEWRVEIVNRVTDDDVWRALYSEIRLVHMDSLQALSISGLALPEWGSHQYEVVTERYHEVPATIWTAEEHKYLRDPASSGDVARQVGRAELLPTAASAYGFWSKLAEIHVKLFVETTASGRSAASGSHDHRFRSSPVAWPLGLTNIVYWIHGNSSAQIHMVANPIVWWSTAAATAATSVLLILAAILRQLRSRQGTSVVDATNQMQPAKGCHVARSDARCSSLSEEERHYFRHLLFLGGYALHYVPFFFTDDVLFLYCYLPSFVFSVLCLVSGVDSLTRLYPASKTWLLAASVAWTACAATVSQRLSPLVYGTSELTADEWQLCDATLGWDRIERR